MFRKEGGEKRGEGKKGGKKEGKKERRQKKECKCVFRLKKMIGTLPPPPPPQSTNSDQGLGKNDMFFIDRKEDE